MSSLLKEKYTLIKLREERRSFIEAVKGSGAWPEIAGKRGKKKKG